MENSTVSFYGIDSTSYAMYMIECFKLTFFMVVMIVVVIKVSLLCKNLVYVRESVVNKLLLCSSFKF